MIDISRMYHIGYDSYESLKSQILYTASPMFVVSQSTSGIFAIACDSSSGTLLNMKQIFQIIMATKTIYNLPLLHF